MFDLGLSAVEICIGAFHEVEVFFLSANFVLEVLNFIALLCDFLHELFVFDFELFFFEEKRFVGVAKCASTYGY